MPHQKRKIFKKPAPLPRVPSPEEQLDEREVQKFQEVFSDFYPDLTSACELRQVEDELALALGQMRPLERKVNVLVADGHLPVDIAEQLGCALPTVYSNRSVSFLALHDRRTVLTMGATRSERVGWLRTIAMRSMDETDRKWFAPKTALAAIQQLSQLSGDLDSVKNDAPPSVTITIDLIGKREKEVSNQ